MHSLLARPVHAISLLLITLHLSWWPVVARTSTSLPSSVSAALARAKVPPEALAALVVDVQGSEAARLRWQVDVPMNPASVMKLVTTYAALDLLGPAFTWDTPVYLDGALQGGRLRGNVYDAAARVAKKRITTHRSLKTLVALWLYDIQIEAYEALPIRMNDI